MVRLLSLLISLGMPLAAAATDIYRCQTPEGVAYQDRPCEGPGGPIKIRVYRPTSDEVSRTEQGLSRMRALVNTLEQPTQEREKPAAGTGQASTPAPASAAAGGAAGNGSARDTTAERKSRRSSSQSTSDACPLGLANCKKADPRVFRRPGADVTQTPQ